LAARTRFLDQRNQRDAEFIVLVEKGEDELTLLLDLDVSAKGGFSSGECRIGMAKEYAIEMVHLLVEAIGRSAEPLPEWDRVGNVPYSWWDRGVRPGPDRIVSVLVRRGQIRVVISSPQDAVADGYIATMTREAAERLIEGMSQGLALMGSLKGPG